MKRFDVITKAGAIAIDAERIERHTFDDKPEKIIFITGDAIVAEFYCDNICGWAERREG